MLLYLKMLLFNLCITGFIQKIFPWNVQCISMKLLLNLPKWFGKFCFFFLYSDGANSQITLTNGGFFSYQVSPTAWFLQRLTFNTHNYFFSFWKHYHAVIYFKTVLNLIKIIAVIGKVSLFAITNRMLC